MKILSIQNPQLSKRTNLHYFCDSINKIKHDLLLFSGDIVKCTDVHLLHKFKNIYKRPFNFITSPLFFHHWSIAEGKNYLSKQFQKEYLSTQNPVFLGRKLNKDVFLTGIDAIGYEKNTNYRHIHKQNIKKIDEFKNIKYENTYKILSNIKQYELQILFSRLENFPGIHYIITHETLIPYLQHNLIRVIQGKFLTKDEVNFSGDFTSEIIEI